MRVLLDPNVLISAALSGAGPPALIVKAWLDGRIDLVVSPRLLGEVENVLVRPRIIRLVGDQQRMTLLADLRSRATLVEDPDPTRAWTRDPKDDYLVELGIVAHAVIVTGDDDLHAATIPVPVITPRGFLERLDRV